MNAPRPKLDIDRTRDRLLQLGCVHAAEQLDTLLADAVRKPVAAHEFLEVAARGGGQRPRDAPREDLAAPL